jgi:hypothetical protein
VGADGGTFRRRGFLAGVVCPHKCGPRRCDSGLIGAARGDRKGAGKPGELRWGRRRGRRTFGRTVRGAGGRRAATYGERGREMQQRLGSQRRSAAAAEELLPLLPLRECRRSATTFDGDVFHGADRAPTETTRHRLL